MDQSSGYESVAPEFLAGRGNAGLAGIGARDVSKWAQSLPNGAAVLDLGCGPGLPTTKALVAEGLNVFALDGSPSFVQAFQRNFPEIPILCEAVQDSTFFGRTFDG